MQLSEIEVNDSFPSKNQVESLIVIIKIVIKNRKKLTTLDYKNSNLELIEIIRLLANEIYSACEIINQMLISIYLNNDRYRGNKLKQNFNGNFKKVYETILNKDKEVQDIYKDEFISDFFYSSKSWFIRLHDIRTQETHYEVGRIEFVDGIPFYVNGNRHGVSTQIYSNPSNETRININDFILVVDNFLQIEEKLSIFIKNYRERFILHRTFARN